MKGKTNSLGQTLSPLDGICIVCVCVGGGGGGGGAGGWIGKSS